MEIFLIVIAIVVLFPFLRNCWLAFFHPATILGNQAAKMNWIIDGREKDGIVNNMRYRRGNLIAVIPFNNPSVLLRYNGTEKRFRDFIEVERWIGREIGIRDLEIDQRVDHKEIRKKELEVEQLFAPLNEEENFRKLELEVEQLCTQLDEEARISEKELEYDQRVNQKIEKFANYDFESAGKDISKNEIQDVFDNFRESLEGSMKVRYFGTDGFKKFVKDGGLDSLSRDLGKRCGYSLGALLHYDNSKKIYSEPEETFVRFSYAMYMVYSGFWEYNFERRYLYPPSLREEALDLSRIFKELLMKAMLESYEYIMNKEVENNYFKFYSEYEDSDDDGEDEFWEERADLTKQILSVRNSIPRSVKRSFINGYESPEAPDTFEFKTLAGKAESSIYTNFIDYALVKERLLSNPKEDPIQFLKDTKFLYNPIFVRFFFKPGID